MNNKYNELLAEIETKQPHIIMICETWWREESSTAIPGYTLYRQDRGSRGGGVCIYINDNLNSFEVKETCFGNPNVEQVWCSISINNESILCGCLYRVGEEDVEYCKHLLESIKQAQLLQANKQYTGLLICGDFNFDEITWSSENVGIVLFK
jgi:Endonuclease/Exonuclease/phosphatase family